MSARAVDGSGRIGVTTTARRAGAAAARIPTPVPVARARRRARPVAAGAAVADGAPMASSPAKTPPPTTTTTTRLVGGLRELLSEGGYTGIFLDQFGVLHDGRNAYPRAAEAVRRAATTEGGGGAGGTGPPAPAKVVIVSNSSRRSAGALARLERLGFDPSWFYGAVTSGEITHAALEGAAAPGGEGDEGEGDDEAWAMVEEEGEEGGRRRRRRRRTRVLHLTWAARGGAGSGGGVSLPAGYATVGADADAAELIVAHGTEGVSAAASASDAPAPIPMSLPEIERLLERAASRADPPPMLVANPDYVTVDGSSLAVMPGTLARHYARAGGGPVVLMGKPSARIYREARALAEADGGGGGGGGAGAGGGASFASEGGQRQQEGPPHPRPRERWLAIGDSLEHDVAGAAAAARELGADVEVDALFVAAGIHAEELGFVPPGDLAEGNGGVRRGAWAELAGGRASGRDAPAALGELCSRLGVDPPAFATGYLEW